VRSATAWKVSHTHTHICQQHADYQESNRMNLDARQPAERLCWVWPKDGRIYTSWTSSAWHHGMITNSNDVMGILPVKSSSWLQVTCVCPVRTVSLEPRTLPHLQPALHGRGTLLLGS